MTTSSKKSGGAFEDLPQSKKFHAPLQEGDSVTATRGCRHTQPDICKKNEMPGVCAFARRDNMCHAPPTTWPKQYTFLRRRAGT